MPKQTFFNLPEAKRANIIEAAKQVFYNNSYDEASINQIIKLAKIPRGSFYQYFEDKDDIYCYIGSLLRQQLLGEVQKELPRCDYDPFKLAKQVLPEFLTQVFYGDDANYFYRRVDMLYHQERLPDKKAFLELHSQGDKLLQQETLDKMASKVQLVEESDLIFLLQSIFWVFISCVRDGMLAYEAGKSVDLDRIKLLLNRRLDYLQTGFQKAE